MNNSRKSERIFEAVGNADEELLERCEAHKGKHTRHTRWVKWGASAACVCLLAVGGITFKNSLTGGSNPTIISSDTSGMASGIYAAPENGETIFQTGIQSALDEGNKDNTLYFVAIDLFQDKTPLNPGSDAAQTELKRLEGYGYKVGYATAWTYQGNWEKVDLHYLAGYFTKEQLEDFEASPSFGYSFSFATNGDGTPVDAEQPLSPEFH
ncbi:hypothetical protein [Hungatella hathewayi]|uniref:hypothetical protein n=1 Tax=Hungatella hathewayi TaxID=154046 RepID=UPI00033741B9|nr:hypothetical protein [Hungatella hathewayi]CCZ61930.1 putative uncharacterized protein [Hungatella hathewayi CAG:224]